MRREAVTWSKTKNEKVQVIVAKKWVWFLLQVHKSPFTGGSFFCHRMLFVIHITPPFWIKDVFGWRSFHAPNFIFYILSGVWYFDSIIFNTNDFHGNPSRIHFFFHVSQLLTHFDAFFHWKCLWNQFLSTTCFSLISQIIQNHFRPSTKKFWTGGGGGVVSGNV